MSSLLSASAPPSRLIEYGSYNGHYYGTSLDSVNRVMAEGKVCLLDVHPGVSIRTSEKLVFVIYTKQKNLHYKYYLSKYENIFII